jgi:oligosaccharide repeat unit polymerase
MLNMGIVGGALFVIVYWRRLLAIPRILCAISVLLYCLSAIYIGNRREVVGIVVCAIAMHEIVARTRFSVVSQVALLACFVGGIGWGYVRSSDVMNSTFSDRSSLWESIGAGVALNEFSVPIQTLLFELERPDHQKLYGTSYLRLPVYLIPRSVWPEKPVSLSTEFLMDLAGTLDFQGFAYTPMTEAFRNFGYVGFFIVPLLLGIFLELFVWRAKNFFASYAVATALVIDFGRGEAALTMWSALVMILTYKILELGTRSRRNYAG